MVVIYLLALHTHSAKFPTVWKKGPPPSLLQYKPFLLIIKISNIHLKLLHNIQYLYSLVYNFPDDIATRFVLWVQNGISFNP